jgi:hypothetical protein
MAAAISITQVYYHKGGNLIFSGKVTQGQVLDKGWSKLETGKLDEIRDLENKTIRYALADTNTERLFVCSKMRNITAQ